MPMVRAMRLLNSIEAGTTTGAQLEAQLQNGGVQSDFNSVLQLPGQMTAMAGSNTAINAINGSASATSLTGVSPAANFALSNTASAVSNMSSSARTLLQSCSNANPANWIPKSTFATVGGATQNNSVKGVDPTVGSNGIAYGNGIYVAIQTAANSRGVSTSTDGLTWTTTANALPAPTTSAQWANITFGNGYFVAVSGGNAVSTIAAYSTNGTTWTSATLPTSSQWTNLAFGNIGGTNYFVAISGGAANSTATAYSTNNGATWTAGGSIGTSARWNAITFGNGRFVACAGGGPFGSAASTATAYSTNGTTWTVGGTFPVAEIFYQVAYGTLSGTGYFVTAGTASNVYYSTDGVSWGAVGSPTGQAQYGVVYGNNVFLLLGNALLTSSFLPNISTATAFTNGAQTGNINNATRCIFDGSKFVAVSTTASTYGIFNSTTTPVETNYFYKTSVGNFIATCSTYYNGIYYVFGRNGYYYSSDAVNWTFVIVPAFTNLAPVAVSINSSGTCVAILGFGVSTTYIAYTNNFSTTSLWNMVNMSTSGVGTAAWSDITVGKVAGVDNFVAVSGYQLGGTSLASNNSFAYSTDGQNWLAGSGTTTTAQYSSVVYAGGTFYASTYNNTAWFTSTNASTWIAYTGSANGGIQMASGNVANIPYIISTQGLTTIYYNIPSVNTTWTAVTLPNATTISICAYANGFFFACAYQSSGNPIIYYSTNPVSAANWFPITTASSTAYKVLHLTYGNGLVIATNYNNATANSALNMVNL